MDSTKKGMNLIVCKLLESASLTVKQIKTLPPMLAQWSKPDIGTNIIYVSNCLVLALKGEMTTPSCRSSGLADNLKPFKKG